MASSALWERAMRGAAVLLPVFGLLAGCSPFELASDSADLERCTELSRETVDEAYSYIVSESDITLDMITNFRNSPAYLANPDAWDWSTCLTRLGWNCTGGTGIGTLAPTPPTQCDSPEGDDMVIQTVINPFID